MDVLRGFRNLTSLLLTLGLFFAAMVTGPVARGVPNTAELTSAQRSAAKNAKKGRIKVVLTGAGTYTVVRKRFRKTASVSKTFRVAPGRYRVKAPGASVKPAKVKVRAGKTVKVRVTFKATALPPPTGPPTPAPPAPPGQKINPHTITAGGAHTCGIDTAGKAWCWGSDQYGQLGDGNDGQGTEYAPVAVAGGLTFTQLTASRTGHTCGIDTAQRAWCWGRDYYGQLGDGDDTQAAEYAPVQVQGGHAFVQLTAAPNHSCGIDTAGNAWCWGGDISGEIGDGPDNGANEYSPVAVAGGLTYSRLSASGNNTCGLTSTGAAWCWGADFSGQLGDGNPGPNEFAPVPVATNRTFTDLATGNTHSCAVETTGKAWCWGSDASGQLGDGNDGQGDESAPVMVSSGVSFTRLVAGYDHTCGVDSTGKAWCWGSDASGQLGDGNDGQATEYAPAPVLSDATFAVLAAGSEHTCGVTTTGTAWCWGKDLNGQLGDGNDGQATEYAPVAVAGGLSFATTY